jgi:hypothetical protein
MSNDNVFGISEAIRKASEAYVQALTTVTKALQGLASQANTTDRDRLVENWLRVARMSKDGIITALESGFQYWENEIRRNAATATRGTATAAEGKNGRKTGARRQRLLPADRPVAGPRNYASKAKQYRKACRKASANGKACGSQTRNSYSPKRVRRSTVIGEILLRYCGGA